MELQDQGLRKKKRAHGQGLEDDEKENVAIDSANIGTSRKAEC